jgi:YteA family regulatory protein
LLTPERIVAFRDRLIDERAAATDRLREVTGSAGFDEPESEWAGELSQYDNHTSDSGPALEMRAINLGLVNHERDTIAQIDSALERIRGGTYGICTECGRDIPIDRLEALPYAETCTDCGARMAAPRGTGTRRPIEEEVLRPPFGGRDPARAFDDPGIHGEDMWDQLAQYGTANSPQDEEAGNSRGADRD